MKQQIVGYFVDPTNANKEVHIVQRENESPEDAISRVATEHKMNVSSVILGEPPSIKLAPLKELAAKLVIALDAGQLGESLLSARRLVNMLDVSTGQTSPHSDNDADRAVDFEAVQRLRDGANRYFHAGDKPAKETVAALPSAVTSYDNIV